MAKKKTSETNPKLKNKTTSSKAVPLSAGCEGEASSSRTAVVDALRQAVAVTYAAIAQTHICHWNVRGPSFFALHTAFEMQYTELFTAVDELAERIRALGALAPGGLANLAGMSGVKEIQEDASADAMVKHLVEVNNKVVEVLKVARDAAGDVGDVQSEDLMIGRIQVHEKTIWMLRSYLEG